MATLGEKLRREREVRGVSLQEISKATRIHENFLYALEENDFGSFPAAVFVTGFLRNYATHLGLDADKIVAEYEGMKIERQAELPHVPVEEAPDNRLIAFGVVGALFLLLVVYIGYVNWPGEGPDERTAKIKIEPKPAVKSPPVKAGPEKKAVSEKAAAAAGGKAPPAGPEAKAPVKKEPKAAVVAAEPKKAPVVKAPVVAAEPKKAPVVKAAVKKEPKAAVAAVAPKVKKEAVKKTVAKKVKPKPAPVKRYRHRLVVEAGEEDVWILVVVDDELVRDMFVRAGQKVVIRGNDSFNFTTGNARQVKLTMDGKPLEFEAPPSNVIRSWNLLLPE